MSNSRMMINAIQKFVNISGCLTHDNIAWSSTASLLFLEKLYFSATIYLDRKYLLWNTFKNWRPKKITQKMRTVLQELEHLQNS